MPCLNEEKTIAICIQKALSFFERNNISGEILVIDNGSSDNSVDIVRSYSPYVNLITVEEKGYGNALIAGINNASGNWIIMGDADDTYDFNNLEKFITGLQQGYDIILGNRFKGKIEKNPKIRIETRRTTVAGSKFVTMVIRWRIKTYRGN